MGVQDNKYDNCYNGQFIQVYMHQTLQHNKFYPALLPGFKRCGGLVVAQTKDRLTFLKRRAAIGRYVDDDSGVSLSIGDRRILRLRRIILRSYKK